MKNIFLILILFSLLFSNPYDSVTYSIQKNWTLYSNNTKQISLDGFLFVKNKYQKIISIETNGNILYEGEFVKIHFFKDYPNEEEKVFVNATVHVFYPNGFYDKPLETNILPLYPEDMQYVVKSCKKNSTLETAMCLNSWIYKNMYYDESYYSKNISPLDSFRKRRGVCYDYSKILIAFFDMLNLSSRMVDGYVLQNGSITAHSWVELILDNQTIPMDPTFGQIGVLSNNHLISYYSINRVNNSYITQNHSLEYVYIKGVGGNVSVNTHFNMSVKKTNYICNAPVIMYEFDNISGNLNVSIINPTDKYIFTNYKIITPPQIFGKKEGSLLIKPESRKVFYLNVNKENLEEGLQYTIPVIINTTCENKEIDLTLIKKTNEEKNEVCYGAFFLLLPVLFYSVSIRGAK